MNTRFLLTTFLVAEDSAANAIAPGDQVYKCETAPCPPFTSYKIDVTTMPKVGSTGWTFGFKHDQQTADASSAKFPDWTDPVVGIDMTIPHDPVFLVEIQTISAPDSVIEPLINWPANSTSLALPGLRWGNNKAAAAAAAATASATDTQARFACEHYSLTGAALSKSDTPTILDIADFANWDPTMIPMTTMLLTNAEVKQGFFQFKGVSGTSCAVCAANITDSQAPTSLPAPLPAELFFANKLMGTGTKATIGAYDHQYSYLPTGNSAFKECTNVTNSHLFHSNTPGIFKSLDVSSTLQGPYADQDTKLFLQTTPTYKSAIDQNSTMNVDHVHIQKITLGTAPLATVTLQGLPNRLKPIYEASQPDSVVAKSLRGASYFVIAVQAGLYNLGGFFNASADSIKEGIKFGFTDIIDAEKSTGFENEGFIHYQYTLLPPSDLIAATPSADSLGMTIPAEAACQGEDAEDSVKSATTPAELILNNDSITFKLLQNAEGNAEAIASNYAFQGQTKAAYNACGEIGGASMYVFADGLANIAGLADSNHYYLPWFRGEAITFDPATIATANGDPLGLGDELPVAALLNQFLIEDGERKRMISLNGGEPSLVDSSLYPKMMLNYAISYLQMNAVDGQIIGGVPFVSTDAPGPAWTTVWKFADATGLSGQFSEATLVNAEYTSAAQVNYHIGGSSALMMIIIGCVVGAIVLAGVGYYFYTNKGDGAQAASSGSVADDTDEA